MTKKMTYAIAACVSLMLEKDTIEYRHAFFTRKEIVDRTDCIFPYARKVSEADMRDATHEEGNSGSDKFFRKGSEDSAAEYIRLDENVDPSVIADLLIDVSEWSRKSDYTKTRIISSLNGYMSMVHDMSFSVQEKNEKLITREAVWIATAVLAFNEYHRTESTNPEQYFFRQRTIGKLASQYMMGDSYVACTAMARTACVVGNKANNNYLDRNPNGSDTRRLTYNGEYDNTSPDVDGQFKVNTILGVLPLERVIEFVDTTYTAMFVPADDADDERFERYVGAITDDRLYQIARERGTEEPILSVHSETATYARDRYISAAAKRWAKGKCQLCDNDAPFDTPSGEPYLESHHICWLSQGGADTIFNVVALCPNCHRKMHIVNDEKDVSSLKMKVARAVGDNNRKLHVP